VSDAQFSIARLYRPDLLAMQKQYQGLSARVPLAVPGTLSPVAGTDGNLANLLDAIPVPLGSRVIVWLPSIAQLVGRQAGIRVASYSYRFLWRLRPSTPDGQAFHLPGREGGGPFRPGAIDSLKATDNAIAGAWCPPVNLQDLQNQVDLTENVVFPDATVPLDLSTFGGINYQPKDVQGTPMQFEEGVLNQVSGLGSLFVSYNVIQLDAMGDELSILMNPGDLTGDWDFTDSTKDQPLYDMLTQYRDFGIYVICGTGSAGCAPLMATQQFLPT
jgi:hypothetical protein